MMAHGSVVWLTKGPQRIIPRKLNEVQGPTYRYMKEVTKNVRNGPFTIFFNCSMRGRMEPEYN